MNFTAVLHPQLRYNDFVIDSVNYSAEVLSVDGDGDIATFKFHGSSTTIGESSNFMWQRLATQ